MIPDYDMLHQQLAHLCRSAAADRDRCDAVATQIGRTIAALAGWNALVAAFDYVEVNVGEREAVWLSRRWSGIVDPAGACWG